MHNISLWRAANSGEGGVEQTLLILQTLLKAQLVGCMHCIVISSLYACMMHTFVDSLLGHGHDGLGLDCNLLRRLQRHVVIFFQELLISILALIASATRDAVGNTLLTNPDVSASDAVILSPASQSS